MVNIAQEKPWSLHPALTNIGFCLPFSPTTPSNEPSLITPASWVSSIFSATTSILFAKHGEVQSSPHYKLCPQVILLQIPKSTFKMLRPEHVKTLRGPKKSNPHSPLDSTTSTTTSATLEQGQHLLECISQLIHWNANTTTTRREKANPAVPACYTKPHHQYIACNDESRNAKWWKWYKFVYCRQALVYVFLQVSGRKILKLAVKGQRKGFSLCALSAHLGSRTFVEFCLLQCTLVS